MGEREGTMVDNLPVLTSLVQLSYDRYGANRPPLVLIHGFPLDHTIWKQQIEDLQNVTQVIAPDLRGSGKSPAPQGAYSMDLMARDVLSLLDRLGVYKAIWVGH